VEGIVEAEGHAKGIEAAGQPQHVVEVGRVAERRWEEEQRIVVEAEFVGIVEQAF